MASHWQGNFCPLASWGRQLCWVCVAREGLQGWLLSEAARSFPGSNSDPPLAKAEPVSNGGSASVIAYLRRGKRLLGERVKRWRKVEGEEEEEDKLQ